MSSSGLFTRVDQKVRKDRAPKRLEMSADSLHRMGVKAVRSMNPEAEHPEIEPRGSKRPWVYVLGEAPSERDDRDGEFFCDSIGRLLLDTITKTKAGRELESRLRFNNCVRTLPKRRNGSRMPVPVELEAFRPSVEEDIARTQPPVILGLGITPLKWAMGDGFEIGCCRGRMFPIRVLGHDCWFYSVHHPQYIQRVTDRLLPGEKIPGQEYKWMWERDIRWLMENVKELPDPHIEDEKHLFDGITCLTGSADDLRFLRKFVERMKGVRSAFDLETNRLRPYEQGAKVLSMAIGTKKEVVAFGVDHTQAAWTKDQRAEVDGIILDYLTSDSPKEAHNLSFDLEWSVAKWGVSILEKARTFHCTQAMAYVLDERQGGLSLNFQTSLYFGFSIKSMSKGKSNLGGLFGEEEADINRSQLERTDLKSVLLYNGLDSKYTNKTSGRQRKLLKERGQWELYYEHVDRVPSLVLAQYQGLPVGQEKVREFQETLGSKHDETLDEIDRTEAVRKYTRRFGRFSPTSPQHLVTMFRDFLKRDEGIVKGRNGAPDTYTTEEEALGQMKDEPLAKLILDMRGYGKLKRTYVDPLDLKNPKRVLYPDGLLHCQFKHTSTDTGRLSAEKPSVQNFPKREDAWVRETIGRCAGMVVLAVDHGQLEARVIAMGSKDKFLVKALWENYDIHLEWAEKIARASKKTWRRYKKDIKALRQDTKNMMVFPAFYGSQLRPICRNLEIEENVMAPLFEEFWDTFHGVREWQKRIISFYRLHGYIQGLSGRRRHGPMSENMMINAGVQGDASDLVIYGMNRMREHAVNRNQLWLCPRLNIHDDLTFIVPKAAEEEAQDLIIRTMLGVPWDWINVPLQVEVSRGRSWYPLKEVGKFRSDQYAKAEDN